MIETTCTLACHDPTVVQFLEQYTQTRSDLIMLFTFKLFLIYIATALFFDCHYQNNPCTKRSLSRIFQRINCYVDHVRKMHLFLMRGDNCMFPTVNFSSDTMHHSFSRTIERVADLMASLKHQFQ